MFEIELQNPETMVVKTKDKTVAINIEQSEIDAGLPVGVLKGAGEYELGDISIAATATAAGNTMYRLDIGGVKLGLVGAGVKTEELDELGPIDVLGAVDHKLVPIIEPKILIPMGNMDFAEVKAEVKVEKKLKIKSASALPAVLEVYRLG